MEHSLHEILPPILATGKKKHQHKRKENICRAAQHGPLPYDSYIYLIPKFRTELSAELSAPVIYFPLKLSPKEYIRIDCSCLAVKVAFDV